MSLKTRLKRNEIALRLPGSQARKGQILRDWRGINNDYTGRPDILRRYTIGQAERPRQTSDMQMSER